MNKLDQTKLQMTRGLGDASLSQTQSKITPKKIEEMSEVETMAMRVNLLGQQEMQRLNSNTELIKLLKSSQESSKITIREIRQIAHEVRDYPAEAVAKVGKAVDAALQDCRNSAQQAQKVYEQAQKTVSNFERNILYWLLIIGFCSPMVLVIMQYTVDRWL